MTPTNLDKYKSDLKHLVETGGHLQNAMAYECRPIDFKRILRERASSPSEVDAVIKELPRFAGAYQRWYSEAQAIIKILLPDRLHDFVALYEKPKNRKTLAVDTYVIADYLQGITTTGWDGKVIVDKDAALPQFAQQLEILRSAQGRFESSLFDIKQLVQADLLDSELQAAEELTKKGFHRAAGAVIGVVLEKHLSQVCSNHSLTVGKKHPTIADFNDLLKTSDVIDVPQWRKIQHLGDIRNKCDHTKTTEPTADDIQEMLAGTTKVTKTLF